MWTAELLRVSGCSCAYETIATSTSVNVLKIQRMIFGKESWRSVKKLLEIRNQKSDCDQKSEKGWQLFKLKVTRLGGCLVWLFEDERSKGGLGSLPSKKKWKDARIQSRENRECVFRRESGMFSLGCFDLKYFQESGPL